jgi:peptidoglycan/xylan/chitin deacetylase (PgdA/CDA1 family)
MRLAHNIGNEAHSNYHTREAILACQEPIGFDGVYRNVYENQDILEHKSGIMFVMGNFMGGNNQFDLEHVPKLEAYCTLSEVKQLCGLYEFEIGWHTWSHRDLTTLSDREVIQEITSPFQTKYLRYPYGNYDDRVVELVKQAGYEKAYSATQGVRNEFAHDAQYKIYSDYVPFT